MPNPSRLFLTHRRFTFLPENSILSPQKVIHSLEISSSPHQDFRTILGNLLDCTPLEEGGFSEAE